MSGNEKPTGAGSWSGKVNPKRAKAEAAEKKRQQDTENLFAELFGAPDETLQAQMQESWNILAAIGQDIIRQQPAVAPATQGEAE